MATAVEEPLLVKDRYAWVPAALDDGSELGSRASRAAKDFLMASTFVGIAGVARRYPHLYEDQELAAWLRDTILVGLEETPFAPNPKLDAALLLCAGVQALGARIGESMERESWPPFPLPGEDLWKRTEATRLPDLGCSTIVVALRPYFDQWCSSIVRHSATPGPLGMMMEEPMSQSSSAIRAIKGFFGALESNRTTGILRALIWGGILSLRWEEKSTALRPNTRGAAAWVTATLTLASTVGGSFNGQTRSCHPLLDESLLSGEGTAAERVGLAATVLALAVAGSPVSVPGRNLFSAYGHGSQRSDMVRVVAQLLEGCPAANRRPVVEQGYFAGTDLKRVMVGEDSFAALGPTGQAKVNPWAAGVAQEGFAIASWSHAVVGSSLG